MEELLFKDITKLIEESRNYVANTVNTTLVLLYWKIGTSINSEILQYTGPASHYLLNKYAHGKKLMVISEISTKNKAGK